MRIHLRTRGKSRDLDYRWVGESPPEEWWVIFGRACKFEDRSLIVKRFGSSTRVFISGIGSKRKDKHETPIRYSIHLVLEEARESLAMLPIIADWLAEVKAGNGNCLGEAIDSALPEAFIEDVLEKKKAIEHESLERVFALLGRENRDIKIRDSKFDSWVADIRGKSGVPKFLGAIKGILSGKPGMAIYANLIETVSEADGIKVGAGENLAVLCKFEPFEEKTKEIKKKTISRSSRPEGKRNLGNPNSEMVPFSLPKIVLVLLAILLGIGAIIITQSPPASPPPPIIPKTQFPSGLATTTPLASTPGQLIPQSGNQPRSLDPH